MLNASRTATRKTVFITDFEKISDAKTGEGYIVYTLNYTLGDEGNNIIRKRYSDFQQLHVVLRKTLPNVKPPVELPPKFALVLKKSDDFLENRREKLEAYINGVANMPQAVAISAFSAFLKERNPARGRAPSEIVTPGGAVVRLEGFLTKQGAVWNSWKRRYFRLLRYPLEESSEYTLHYYKHPDDPAPLGTLPSLHDCKVEVLGERGRSRRSFGIFGPDRTLLLDAETDEDYHLWLSNLRAIETSPYEPVKQAAGFHPPASSSKLPTELSSDEDHDEQPPLMDINDVCGRETSTLIIKDFDGIGTTLQWYSEPSSSSGGCGWRLLSDNKGLVIIPEPGRDLWRQTFYTPELVKDDAACLLAPLPWSEEGGATGELTVETAFTLRPRSQFDQAGLVVRIDSQHWIKAGIEFVDGTPRLSCVVTNKFSDWSTQEWQPGIAELQQPGGEGTCSARLKLHKVAQAFSVAVEAAPYRKADQAGIDRGDWRFVRIGHLASSSPFSSRDTCQETQDEAFDTPIPSSIASPSPSFSSTPYATPGPCTSDSGGMWRVGVYAACPVAQAGCDATFHYFHVGPRRKMAHEEDPSCNNGRMHETPQGWRWVAHGNVR